MNINTNCPHCNGSLTVDEKWRGQQMECPYCGKTFDFGSAPAAAQGFSSSAPQQKRQIKEYKVLTQKDKWFSGKFDPEKLEGAINAYERQGWRVIGCATASIPGLLNNSREEMIVIMERG